MIPLARADRHDAGFTLFEMLVALAILGMLAAMLLAALKGPSDLVQRLVHGQTGQDQVVAAQSRLRWVLERLRPTLRLDSVGKIIDLRGTAHDISLFAPVLPSNAPDALKRYRLLLNATGDLVLYTANDLDERIDINAPGLVGWQPTVLLSGVEQVGLAYFGIDPSGTGRSWQVSWTDRTQLPDLIRIRVDFMPGDRRSWPELLVRPGASGRVTCAPTALSSPCPVS